MYVCMYVDRYLDSSASFKSFISSDIFYIDPLIGYLGTHGNLDREQNSSHVFVVKATDSDPTSPRSNTAVVLVKILDENDNSPSFPRNSYTLNVTEDATIGHRVAKVTLASISDRTFYEKFSSIVIETIFGLSFSSDTTEFFRSLLILLTSGLGFENECTLPPRTKILLLFFLPCYLHVISVKI